MRVAKNVLDLIGRTPIVKLHKVVPKSVEVYLKLESFNPGGSVKDRPALFMINEAERQGILKTGSVVVEPTSGNTGIGLALVCAIKGYRCIIVLPETASSERLSLLKAYGAEVIQTEGDLGMVGAVEYGKQLAKELNAFMPSQFDNDYNSESHRQTTSLEIIKQMEGRIDGFISSAGSGGTITGNGEVLKEKFAEIKIAVVEPAGSPLLSGGQPGKHRIPGMGPGFIPYILNQETYDYIYSIEDESAIEMTRRLAREEGILCGPSTGAVVCGVNEFVQNFNAGARIVAVSADGGERYLTTGIFK